MIALTRFVFTCLIMVIIINTHYGQDAKNTVILVNGVATKVHLYADGHYTEIAQVPDYMQDYRTINTTLASSESIKADPAVSNVNPVQDKRVSVSNIDDIMMPLTKKRDLKLLSVTSGADAY